MHDSSSSCLAPEPSAHLRRSSSELNIYHNIIYICIIRYILTYEPDIVEASRQNEEVAMFEDKTKVLLMVPQGVLDRARGFAGEAMSKLKRPVSLQMVLRALIDEGLKRDSDGAVLVNVEGQVQAVRRIRSRAGLERSRRKDQRMHQSGVGRRVSRRPLQAGGM
jgi:hypothetical protein